MKPTTGSEFSWPLFFFVTGACFFVFSLLVKFLEGDPSHILIFFKTGLVSSGVGVVFTIYRLVANSMAGND